MHLRRSLWRHVNNMGIEQVMIAYRGPWQNPYVERLIGSIIGNIRREYLDHVVVLNEHHLKRIVNRYLGLLPRLADT